MADKPRVGLEKCDGSKQKGQVFKKIAQSNDFLASPDLTEVFRLEDAERPGACIAAFSGSGGNLGKIEVHDCDEKSPLQQFTVKKVSTGGQIQQRLVAAGSGMQPLCFDSGANGIGLYPCYLDEPNANQNLDLPAAGQGGINLQFRDSMCLTAPAPAVPATESAAITLTGCIVDGGITKRGQFFEKIFAPNTDHVFSLRSKDGSCLSVNSDNKFVLSQTGCEVHLFKQDPADPNKRLTHVPTGMCVDGNNGITPTLYTCYSGDNTNQQFDLSLGSTVQLERTQTCFDFEPAQASPVSIIPCAVAETQFRWEEYKPFVPIETRIYNEQKQVV